MWIRSEDRKNLINLLILNGPLVYMSMAAIMGMRLTREEGAGPAYKVFMAALFVIGIFPVFKKVMKQMINPNAFVSLLIVFIYVGIGYIQLTIESKFFLEMTCFAVPATCLAITIDKQDGLKGMMKWLDLFLPVFAVSFVFMVKNMLLSKFEGEENSYDQSASYYSAFCFLIDSFLLRYNDYYPKFDFINHRWYRILKVILLPYYFVICLFSGGRGAAVLLIIGLLYHVPLLKRIPIRLWWRGLFILFILVVCAIWGIGKLSSDYFDLFEQNYDRILAVVEGGHIDTSASSGRDGIWLDALDTWSYSPILGYGLFSYLDHFYIRPHNIFVEMMLQGGLVLLSIFCFILFRAFIKFKKISERDRNQIFLVPFILFIFVELMVSGSYWMEPYFWFVMVYIYNYKISKVNNAII